jgi:RNA polymerase sigma factor (sigma-70 family)
VLAKLPARQREVLHLVFYQDLTIEETAKILHISLGTARTHFERGKTRLRSLLAQKETR